MFASNTSATRLAYGLVIKGLLEQHKMTQGELAQRINMNPSTMCRLTAGIHMLKLDEAYYISDVFKVPIQFIIDTANTLERDGITAGILATKNQRQRVDENLRRTIGHLIKPHP